MKYCNLLSLKYSGSYAAAPDPCSGDSVLLLKTLFQKSWLHPYKVDFKRMSPHGPFIVESVFFNMIPCKCALVDISA